MPKINVQFEKRNRGYKSLPISEIHAGQFFVAGYHDPDEIMRSECNLASVYVKLPRSNRCMIDAAEIQRPSPSEIEAINERRTAFNLSRGTTKAFDKSVRGYLVDCNMQVFFIKE